MTQQLSFAGLDFRTRAVSPFREMGAYEALWCRSKVTFSSLAKQFAQSPTCLPSDFVSPKEAEDCAEFVKRRFEQAKVGNFGVRVHGTGEYPEKLRDAANPIELFYYQGWWDLAFSRSVAVVGTRKPSPEGLSLAERLVRQLVADDLTVVSGLASGIDTKVHETAIAESGRTIAVIGTPLSHVYPKENAELQSLISDRFLILSQVPLKRYEEQDYRRNRYFFPERNVTMAALTEATIIVEAGETSGTLAQARAALKQGRKLFVLDHCFQNPRLSWPSMLAKKGAVRVRDYDDIRDALSTAPD